MTDLDLSVYTKKRIKFSHKVGDESGVETIEGTVDLANQAALLIKPLGGTMLRMFEASAILPDTIEVIIDPPHEIKVKTVGKLSLTNARFHLVDRHGFSLSAINAIHDEQAFNTHAEIDHDDLGHQHRTNEDNPEE